jgi:hypothetical protein
MISNLQIIAAFCFFLYAFLKHPEVLRIDREMVKLFGGLITVINVIKITILGLIINAFFPELYSKITSIYWSIPANHLLAVWWEDSFYVLPYLLLARPIMNIANSKAKYAAITLAFTMFLLTTAHFTAGHMYQGKMGLVTAMYPFVSYSVGGRKGLGTVMMLHIIFDFTTYMAMTAVIAILGG